MSEVLDVFKNLKKHVLAGVSYLIPVVVAGGICCGLGVLFGGTSPWETPGTLGYFFFILGKAGLNLMPVVMSAFIANSIADKGAVGPALIIGMVAQNCGAGFLGGIVGGIFVGIVVLLMKKVKVPKTFNALWSIIVIPVVATVLGDLLIEFAVGKVIVAATGWVTSIASGLGTGNMALIGLVFGIIGALDLGLFCNKALSSVPFALMATIDPATGLPIMLSQQLLLICNTTAVVPPLVCGLATVLLARKFKPSEREAGRAAIFMGLFGITESAIPLCLSSKVTYIACVVGSAVGSVAIAIPGAGSIVAWSGIPNLPGNTNVPATLICWLIGVLAGVAVIFFFKKTPSEEESTQPDTADAKITAKGDEFTLDI